MVDLLLPAQLDNTYRGHKLALWLLGLLVFFKGGMGLGCIFNGEAAATRADGIPLDTFTPACARTVVAFFAIWGLCQLLLALSSLLALVRYRSAVPLLFAFILLEHLGRKVILQFLPVERTGTPPGTAINIGLIVLEIVGLVLALWRREPQRG